MLRFNKLIDRSGRIIASLVLLTAQMTPFFVFAPQVSAGEEPQLNSVSDWCSDFDGGVKIDTGDIGEHTVDPITIKIEQVDPEYTGVTSVEGDGVIPTKVVVKGGENNEEYTQFIYPLVAPDNDDDNDFPQNVSHVIVCYDEIPNTATVEVVKMLSPTNNAGRFDLKIEGTPHKEEAGHEDTTGKVEVDLTNNANITVREAAFAGTDLSDYTTTIVCSDQIGEIDSGSPSDESSRHLDLDTSDITAGDVIKCVFTNTLIPRVGTLIVNKRVVNDDGGSALPSDFSITVNGSDGGSFSDDTETTGSLVFDKLPAGLYTVEENETDGYRAKYECVELKVVVGETTYCNIVNNDIKPKLKVRKIVINDDNGDKMAEDFSLYVNAGLLEDPIRSDGDLARSVAVYKTPDVKAGVEYTVSEDSIDGYTASEVTCVDNETKELVKHPVVLSLEQSVTCTIINDDDKPGIVTLYKQVIKDDGGNKGPLDFVLTVSGGSGFEQHATSGISIMLAAGTYTFGELEQRGYENLGWLRGDCSRHGELTIVSGEEYKCVLVNDDKPGKIIVHKKVVNNNGGTKEAEDFKFKVDGGDWQWFEEDGTNVVEVDAGVHSVVERNSKGYKTKYDGCEKIVVRNGQTQHCYIVNNDRAPRVKVVKMTNPYMHTQDFDFAITVDGEEPHNFTLDGNRNDDQVSDTYTTGKHFQAGLVEITEDSVDGWRNDRLTCFERRQGELHYVRHPFTAKIGRSYVCNALNSQDGEVVVTKYHDLNQNGVRDEGEPVLEDWEMTLEGLTNCQDIVLAPQVSEIINDYEQCQSDQTDRSELTDENGEALFANVDSGWYNVDEVLKDDWTQTGIVCTEPEHEPRETGIESQYDALTVRDETPEDLGNAIVLPGQTTYCLVGNYQEPTQPQVLGETTPEELAPTGQNQYASIFGGILLIGLTLSLARSTVKQ